jgi:MEDS: MEthanogen/methylotroph, DcmR Sensory domain
VVHAEVTKAIREMPSGTHAVLVYDSSENKRDVLFNHLRMGMDTDGLVYACSEESPQNIRSELESSGVDVDVLEQKGILSVRNYDEVYIVNGEVDIPRIIGGFSDLAWKYNDRGLNGVRAAGEMSCFFRNHKVEELMAYEKALHRKFNFPGKAICGYNLVEMGNTESLDVLWPILKAHALVIMTGPHGSFALEPEKITNEKIEGTMGRNLS